MTELTKEHYFGIGQVPKGIGAVLDGWNILEEEFKDPSMTRKVADLRVMTGKCVYNCFDCFTTKLKKTLSTEQIKIAIDQLVDMGVRAIDFLGEGEPTKDEDFFEIIEYTALKGIHPVIFTTATKMIDREFTRRVKATGASVLPKCDSLRNEEFQNRVVGDPDFFKLRNEAIQVLIEEGFNEIREDGSTRLGFDMVISKRNMHEVEKTLRYCRENNIRIVFATYLPSGRSSKKDFDKEYILSEEDKKALSETIKRVDQEYGFDHKIFSNFFTTPCVEFMQICGNGNVTPCPGNPKVIGNIKTENIADIQKRILEKYPSHNCERLNGDCMYRP